MLLCLKTSSSRVLLGECLTSDVSVGKIVPRWERLAYISLNDTLEPWVLSSVAVQVAHVHDEGLMAPVSCTPPKLFHIYWAV